jgi:hypothetical protein
VLVPAGDEANSGTNQTASDHLRRHELVTKRNRDEVSKQVVEAFRVFAYDEVA